MSTKALLLTEVFPPQVGGSGRWLFEVYSRLDIQKVRVVAGEHRAARDFDQTHELKIRRMPLAFPTWGCFDRAGLWHYWRAARELARLIKQEQPEVIHCGRILPEGWLAWMLKMRFGLPYWCFVHGEELQYGLNSRQLAWMMGRVFRAASGVIANSSNTAGMLMQTWGLPARKVHVVHPGVDGVRFAPARLNEVWRRRMGWQGRSVVLTVGRMEKRKGHDMLIRALPRIAASVPNVLYAIVGDGTEREALEQIVSDAAVGPRVQFLGEISSDPLLACYQQCDLFVLPNREVNGDFEGFGMVLVEAQACGKPVIAGASGGTRETMRVGETGETVNCDGPDLLAEEVIRLLLDDARRERMGHAARQWVEAQFDWRRVAEQVEAVTGLRSSTRQRPDAITICPPSPSTVTVS